jgi:hypothetical protein
MAKQSRGRVPKRLLMRMLAELGLTLTRGDFMGRRRWMVTDKNGKTEYFSSLYNVFYRFQHPKTKKEEALIEPYAQRIRMAIS